VHIYKCLSNSCSNSFCFCKHTHAHVHTRVHTRMHTHTHTHIQTVEPDVYLQIRIYDGQTKKKHESEKKNWLCLFQTDCAKYGMTGCIYTNYIWPFMCVCVCVWWNIPNYFIFECQNIEWEGEKSYSDITIHKDNVFVFGWNQVTDYLAYLSS